jgi:hypothetical protein
MTSHQPRSDSPAPQLSRISCHMRYKPRRMTKDFSNLQPLASKRNDFTTGSLRRHTSGFIVTFAPAAGGDDDDGVMSAVMLPVSSHSHYDISSAVIGSDGLHSVMTVASQTDVRTTVHADRKTVTSDILDPDGRAITAVDCRCSSRGSSSSTAVPRVKRHLEVRRRRRRLAAINARRWLFCFSFSSEQAKDNKL